MPILSSNGFMQNTHMTSWWFVRTNCNSAKKSSNARGAFAFKNSCLNSYEQISPPQNMLQLIVKAADMPNFRKKCNVYKLKIVCVQYSSV